MPNKDQKIKEEIKEMEGKLKSLKQKSRGGNQDQYLIPGAILIFGILVAGAIFYTQGGTQNSRVVSNGTTVTQQQAASGTQTPASGGSSSLVKPVNAEDHILGNPDAPVKIVEFSDLECPFCKRFHPTLQQIMDEYGDDGQVAWVYRHYPLDQLHSKARREAAATELANELGGNDAFWAYTDRLFEITPSNDGLQLSQLVQIAADVGLPTQPFQDLVDENDIRGGKYADHIEADFQDANNSGGQGTPYTVVIAENGKTFPISGAQPYSAVKSIIELALEEK